MKLVEVSTKGADMDRAEWWRAHRRDEAAAGFPLLRGCPSTFVLRRLAALDGLSEAERVAYADQLATLAEAAWPLSQVARAAVVAGLPLVARVEAESRLTPDLRFLGVKALARLVAEPDGIAEFLRLQGQPPEAARPPAPHVPSFDAAVPAPPARLRKQVLAALVIRFGGEVRKISSDLEQLVAEVPRGRMVFNLGFSSKGWGAMSRQMDYSLWADLDGVRMVPTAYEEVWMLPAQWDLITVGNVEAAAAHLPQLIEARLALEG